jgi:hypothetical protein
VPLSIAAVLVVSASLTLLIAERKEYIPGTAVDQASPAPGLVREEPTASSHSSKPDAPAPRARDRVMDRPQERGTLLDSQKGNVIGTDAVRSQSAPTKQEGAAGSVLQQASPETAAALEPVPAVPAAAAPARVEVVPSSGQVRAPAEAKTAAPAVRDLSARQPAQDAAGEREGERNAAKIAPAAQPVASEAYSTEKRRAAPAAESAGQPLPESPQKEVRAKGAPTPSMMEESVAPSAWIKRILDLRREGRLKEAADSLKAFRTRYPDYPLPPELSVPQ